MKKNLIYDHLFMSHPKILVKADWELARNGYTVGKTGNPGLRSSQS